MTEFTGILQSGGTSSSTPLAGKTVKLWAATAEAPRLLSSATTSGSGAFTLKDADGDYALLYVTAEVRPGVELMAYMTTIKGIVVNELTTVAAVWCAAQFLRDEGIRGELRRLRVAAAMYYNVVDVPTGGSSSVLTSSPNADETNALRTTRSLANLVAWCVNDPAALRALLDKLRSKGMTPPADLLSALASIARRPAESVGAIYAMSKESTLYGPPLERQPDAWTIAVKVNDSGNDEHPFGGPGNLSFDLDGRAWIANNVVQGEPGSTRWSIVLEIDGRPAPMSPFEGGGLCGPGYGVDVNLRKNEIWFGNFGWGGVEPKNGASLFDGHAHAKSLPDGYGGTTLQKVQGVLVHERTGNVWFASYGNGVVAVFLGGSPDSVATYQGPAGFKPFDIAIASDETVWVTNSNPDTSSIVHLALVPNKPTLQLLGETVIGKTMKGIVIDSSDTIWAASGGNDHVYAFDKTGKLLGGFQGGGMDGPWGLALDGNDDVWVGDFGPLELGSNFHGRVTQLVGTKRADPAHGILLGDAITPQSGYTVPTAGHEVMLRGNTPLYGNGGPKCFIPMFRTTGLKVDAAGNVWTCNNWKPDFDIDTLGGNPGGDGMMIFIGVATPK